MAGYSGTPLPRKLGIKEDATVALLGAPRGFSLGQLPAGVRVRSRAGACDLAIAFARTRAELVWRWDAATRSSASVWIAWPKRSSPLAGELNENVVREHGVAHGWVDFKVAAIDDTWSGLRFAKRRQGRPRS
jgi:hypothetical protein